MKTFRWMIPLAAIAACLAAAVAVWRRPGVTVSIPPPVSDGGAPSGRLGDSFLAPSQIADQEFASATEFLFEESGRTVHADAVDVPLPPLAHESPPQPLAPPATLPEGADAQPINARTALAEEQLEELISEELANLGESERRVWREVLHGLALDEAREILRIWKATGAPPRTSSLSIGSFGAPAASPGKGALATRPDWLAMRQSAVAAVVRENLRHVDTPGYLRSEPPAHGLASTEALRVDLSPGGVCETANPLHLRIDGAGFFMLRLGNRTVLTRNGQFDVSVDGRIVQRRPDGEWSLTPAVQLPAAAGQVHISAAGEVTALVREASLTDVPCGKIELALVLNPQHLARDEADLLRTTPQSGDAVLAQPGEHGAGRLHQGQLQMSNATLVGERERLKRLLELEELWRDLPSMPQPLQ